MAKAKPFPKSKAVKKARSARGRPSDYRDEYAEQTRKLCLLGATDREIANFFEVSEQTINAWKKQHPDFLESLRAGKMKADAQVAQKLFDRATGSEWMEQQAIKVKAGKVEERVEIATVRRAAPPDTNAAMFWLHNRRPDQWRKSAPPVAPPRDNQVPEDYKLEPDESVPDAPIL